MCQRSHEILLTSDTSYNYLLQEIFSTRQSSMNHFKARTSCSQRQAETEVRSTDFT